MLSAFHFNFNSPVQTAFYGGATAVTVVAHLSFVSLPLPLRVFLFYSCWSSFVCFILSFFSLFHIVYDAVTFSVDTTVQKKEEETPIVHRDTHREI